MTGIPYPNLVIFFFEVAYQYSIEKYNGILTPAATECHGPVGYTFILITAVVVYRLYIHKKHPSTAYRIYGRFDENGALLFDLLIKK